MAGLGLELFDAVMLEIGPGRRHLEGPFPIAMVVDHLLLGRRHRRVGGPVHYPYETSGVERGLHMVLVTLSMPNNTIEPHGNVTASATPRSNTSRTSGAAASTLVPPSEVTSEAIVACEGRIFMPLISAGTMIFLLRE